MQTDVTICAACGVQQTCYSWLRFWYCYTCLPEDARGALAAEQAVAAALVAIAAQDPDQAQQLQAALAACATRMGETWQRYIQAADQGQADRVPLYDRYLQELDGYYRTRRTIWRQGGLRL